MQNGGTEGAPRGDGPSLKIPEQTVLNLVRRHFLLAIYLGKLILPFSTDQSRLITPTFLSRLCRRRCSRKWPQLRCWQYNTSGCNSRSLCLVLQPDTEFGASSLHN